MRETSNRPSIVLHGFQGGIVHSAKVARELSEILLDAWVPPQAFAACLPLNAQDDGDSWRVAGFGPDTQSVCSIEICKRDAAVLSLGGKSPLELLGAAATVQRIAAVLADSAGEPNEARLQRPFVVTDRGDSWLLRGSRNIDRAVEGPGPSGRGSPSCGASSMGCVR